MKKLILLLVLVSTPALAQESELERYLEYDEQGLQELVDRANLPQWTEQEKLCLAKNVWYEARNEPVEGQVAVVMVTINRAISGDYPQNLCDVVYQRDTVVKQTYDRLKRAIVVVGKWTVCQFSWTCQRLPPPRVTDPKWQSIQEMIATLISGGYKDWREKYSEVYNYHAVYVNPKWTNLKRYTTTGLHIFYKPKNEKAITNNFITTNSTSGNGLGMLGQEYLPRESW